jgi:hypothetical protein
MVVVRFDVAAIAPDQRINGISESNYPDWQGSQGLGSDLFPADGAIYYLKTTALDGATTLASLNIDQSTSPWFERESATQSFAARQQISVEATLWLRDGVRMDTYLLDLNVVNVPEPTSGFLAAALMAMCGLVRNRGRRTDTSWPASRHVAAVRGATCREC